MHPPRHNTRRAGPLERNVIQPNTQERKNTSTKTYVQFRRPYPPEKYSVACPVASIEERERAVYPTHHNTCCVRPPYVTHPNAQEYNNAAPTKYFQLPSCL